MIYWPLSTVLRNPALNAVHKRELAQAYGRTVMTPQLLEACHGCAIAMPAYNVPLTITFDASGASRFVYLREPTLGEFQVLERGGFSSDGDRFGFAVEPLH